MGKKGEKGTLGKSHEKSSGRSSEVSKRRPGGDISGNVT